MSEIDSTQGDEAQRKRGGKIIGKIRTEQLPTSLEDLYISGAVNSITMFGRRGPVAVYPKTKDGNKS